MTATSVEQQTADALVDTASRERPTLAARAYGATEDGAPPSPPGALRLWRAEVQARYRGQDPSRSSTWRNDPLLHAAQCEANGLDALRDGLPGHARYWFRRAAEIIVAAARARRPS